VKRLKTKTNRVNRTYATPERILKEALNQKGYTHVSLFKIKKHTKRVHRLVMEAFVENVENKETINHKNGIKTDNRLLNLEWNTQEENQQHAIDNNLVLIGEQIGNSILKSKDVYKIKCLLNLGESHRSIAERFKVKRSTVTDINNGRSWSHIKLENSLVTL
jgi:hypothetical protein